MKKTLSVVLALIMLLGCFAVPTFADGENVIIMTDGTTITASNVFESGKTYKITQGVTVSTASNVDVYLPNGASIIIDAGGTLILRGKLLMLSGSLLKSAGTIQNPSNIEVQQGATANVLVHFPKLEEQGLVYTKKNESTGEMETHPRVAVYYYNTDEFDGANVDTLIFDSDELSLAYEVQEPDGDDMEEVELTDQLFYVPWNQEIDVYVPINQSMFIYAHIIESDEDDRGVVKSEVGTNQRDCKYDDNKLDVIVNNGSSIGCYSGIHYTKITGATSISYSAWPSKESDWYEVYKISFPKGEGYEVESAEGYTYEDSPIYVKYNESFSFKVNLDEDYDKSVIFVYIYNGYGWLDVNTEGTIVAEPDQYGWYKIDHVRGDCTIQVLGAIPNETVDKIGGILEIIRNIFNVFKELFDKLFEMLPAFPTA